MRRSRINNRLSNSTHHKEVEEVTVDQGIIEGAITEENLIEEEDNISHQDQLVLEHLDLRIHQMVGSSTATHVVKKVIWQETARR